MIWKLCELCSGRGFSLSKNQRLYQWKIAEGIFCPGVQLFIRPAARKKRSDVGVGCDEVHVIERLVAVDGQQDRVMPYVILIIIA